MKYSLLSDAPSESPIAIDDKILFNLYHQWLNGGFFCVLLYNIFELFCCFYILLFLFFSMLVDYHSLFETRSLHESIRPISSISIFSNFWHFVCFINILGGLFYLGVKTFIFIAIKFPDALTIYNLYSHLGITDITTYAWEDIIKLLIEYEYHTVEMSQYVPPPTTTEGPTSERPTSERPTSERPTSERPTSERPTSEGLNMDNPNFMFNGIQNSTLSSSATSDSFFQNRNNNNTHLPLPYAAQLFENNNNNQTDSYISDIGEDVSPPPPPPPSTTPIIDHYPQLELAYRKRILRQQHFLIGLYIKTINIQLPEFLGGAFYLPSYLQWCINHIIYLHFFSNHHDSYYSYVPHLRNVTNTTNKVKKLQTTFQKVGLFLALSSPIIFFYACIYYIFKHFQNIRLSPKILSTRQYNNYAKIKFQHFNELPHELDYRLYESLPIAENLLNSVRHKSIELINLMTGFICGSLLCICSILLVVFQITVESDFLWGFSLIFYISILGSVYAISTAFINDNDLVNLRTEKKTPLYLIDLMKILSIDMDRSEYCGINIKQNAYDNIYLFKKYYQYKFILLITDIVSIFITPFILIYYMTRISPQIVEFFDLYSVNFPHSRDEYHFQYQCMLSDETYISKVNDEIYKSKMKSSLYK
jgi:hypothetical protein